MSEGRKRQLDRVDLLLRGEPTFYVKQFLSDFGYTIMPDGSFREKDDTSILSSEVASELRLTHFTDRSEMKERCKDDKATMPERMTKETLDDALDRLMRTERDASLTRTNEAIAFNGRADTELRQFVKALTGEDSDLTVTVLQHWMANVKRKMLGKNVQYHMFPVLVGKQGGGKTTALKQLLSAIHWYVMNMSSVQALADERNYKSISEKYVVVFDEMARADKTDAQTLKNLITADTVSARVLGTNRRDQLQVNCSLVGTTNMPVTNLVYDPSGMRRFFEIRCQDVLDWAVINSMDYVGVWKCVDPAREYLQPVRVALAAHQEEIREPSQVESFVDDEGITPGVVDEELDRMSNTRAYELYRGWAERSGHKNTMTVQRFGREMSLLGFPRWRNKRVRGLWVKVSEATHLPDASFAEKGLADLDEIDGREQAGGKKKKGN